MLFNGKCLSCLFTHAPVALNMHRTLDEPRSAIRAIDDIDILQLCLHFLLAGSLIALPFGSATTKEYLKIYAIKINNINLYIVVKAKF